MGLITKNAIEQLIVKIKSEMTTKSDITQLRQMLGAEAEARKGADKVVSFSVTPTLESESQGVRRWKAKINTSAVGILYNYIEWSGSIQGRPKQEIVELDREQMLYGIEDGITFETQIEQVDTVHIWVIKY